MYKRWKTVPDSKTTPTRSNHHPGNAGSKHLGAHLPAKNCCWILVDERTLNDHQQSQQVYLEKRQPVHLEMKQQLNSEDNDVHTQTCDTEHTWRWSGQHTQKKAGE